MHIKIIIIIVSGVSVAIVTDLDLCDSLPTVSSGEQLTPEKVAGIVAGCLGAVLIVSILAGIYLTRNTSCRGGYC